MKSIVCWFACFLLSVVAPLSAHEHREHGPHVHGQAALTIAVDGRGVVADLQGAAAGFISFEHEPVTPEQRAELSRARENLENGAAMIRFSTAAQCRLEGAEVETALTGSPGGHGDLAVHYRFDCAAPERLDSAALGLFPTFGLLQRVLVQYAMPEGQGGAELTPGNPVVNFVPF